MQETVGAQPKWLSEPEMQAWRALVATATGVLATLDRELQAEHGLSLAEYEVLAHCSEQPEGFIRMSAVALRAVRSRRIKKGDPLQTARLAGIMAAKRTSEIIPLCHPLALSHVDVELEPRPRGYAISATASTVGRTGVEMEALVAVAAAALTLYDMVKAIDRTMVIGPVQLVEKRGGRSGHYRRRR